MKNAKTIPSQASLFGEGGMAPPRTSGTPDPAAVRQRLHDLLDTLAGAIDKMPLSDHDLRVWQIVVPNMTKWLPAEEASRIRERFNAEVQRLTRRGVVAPLQATGGG